MKIVHIFTHYISSFVLGSTLLSHALPKRLLLIFFSQEYFANLCISFFTVQIHRRMTFEFHIWLPEN